MPPATLLSAPCRARPTARPADASSAITWVIGTPRMVTTAMISMTYISHLAKLRINRVTVWSSFSKPFSLRSSFIAALISRKPTTDTMIAITILPPAWVSISLILSIKTTSS